MKPPCSNCKDKPAIGLVVGIPLATYKYIIYIYIHISLYIYIYLCVYKYMHLMHYMCTDSQVHNHSSLATHCKGTPKQIKQGRVYCLHFFFKGNIFLMASGFWWLLVAFGFWWFLAFGGVWLLVASGFKRNPHVSSSVSSYRSILSSTFPYLSLSKKIQLSL